MNQERRKLITAAHKRLEALAQAVSDLKSEALDIVGELEQVRDSEQEAYDNLPEGLQAGERGQAMESAVSDLDTAIDALGELDSIDFDEALEALDNAGQ